MQKPAWCSSIVLLGQLGSIKELSTRPATLCVGTIGEFESRKKDDDNKKSDFIL